MDGAKHMPLNFLVFTFTQIFFGLSILLGHIFSQFASTCGNTRASTCSNTRASMLPYGSSTCYYARARLLFKNMPPGGPKLVPAVGPTGWTASIFHIMCSGPLRELYGPPGSLIRARTGPTKVCIILSSFQIERIHKTD